MLVIIEPARRQPPIVRLIALYFLQYATCIIGPFLIHKLGSEHHLVAHLTRVGSTEALQFGTCAVGLPHILIYVRLLDGDILGDALNKLHAVQSGQCQLVLTIGTIHSHQLSEHIGIVLAQPGKPLQHYCHLLGITILDIILGQCTEVGGVGRVSAASLLKHLHAHTVLVKGIEIKHRHGEKSLCRCGVNLHAVTEKLECCAHFIIAETLGSLHVEVVEAG